MSDAVTLYQLAPSPNSIKVRLAFGLKKIPHTLVDTDPTDDAKVVAVSGQPLRPVLVHGGRTVWDSHAILRYIDQTWPAAPRLYSADADEMYEIEEWEQYGRNELSAAIGMLFEQMGAEEVDAGAIKKANEVFAAAAMKVEEALGKNEFLMGKTMNAADLSVAPWIAAGLLDAAKVKDPIGGFFAKHLHLPAKGFDKARAHCKKVMALDGKR